MQSNVFNELKSKLGYLPQNQIDEVEKAFIVARDAHDGQLRSSGEPYITHPVAVALILANMQLDYETIMAALLHDVVEDTPVTSEKLEQKFGKTVSQLVIGVTKLDKLQFKNYKEAQVANIQKMLMAVTQDIRVILIKLADRTHNMRTIGALRPDKRRRIARETLDIYAPIANRLGINIVKRELQKLCFQAYYPTRYSRIEASVKNAIDNNKELANAIQTVNHSIQDKMNTANIPYKLIRINQSLYRIYEDIHQRLHNDRTTRAPLISEYVENLVFKIIVNTEDECYRTLGMLHSLYKPKQGSFQDFIAIPKVNGYQSIHTTLAGPNGLTMEFQIRTNSMDIIAERGITAHWQGMNEPNMEYARKWVESLVNMKKDVSDAFSFISNVKKDLIPNEIYVFTPQGEVIELPNGATPLDFAYAIHTELGLKCTQTIVDHKPYPINRPLSSGQLVQIMTNSNSPALNPQVQYLPNLVTTKARNCVRQHMQAISADICEQLGTRILSRIIGVSTFNKIPTDIMENCLKRHNISDKKGLMILIARGDIVPEKIAEELIPNNNEIINNTKIHETSAVSGTMGLPYSYAVCCHPVPGDKIIAHTSQKNGLIIHRKGCPNLTRHNSADLMEVSWNHNYDYQSSFPTVLNVTSTTNAIPEIISTLYAAAVTVETTNTNIKAIQPNLSITRIGIRVKDLTQLKDVINKLLNIEGIQNVERQFG